MEDETRHFLKEIMTDENKVDGKARREALQGTGAAAVTAMSAPSVISTARARSLA